VVPASEEAPARLPRVTGVEHRFVQAGGVRLHVAEAGAGDPVVLLHGWPQHWYCWRQVMPRLAGEHRVLCPDLRGFGWSDAPRSSYTKDELAGDVIALFDALELDRVRLVGHDWGGFIGFLVALRAPERIRDLLAFSIVHPWASRPRAAMLPRLPLLAYQPLVAAPFLGPLAQRMPQFYDAIFALAGGSRVWSAEERDTFADVLREPARAEAASRLYRTFLVRELPAILRGSYARQRLTVPTRLVIGHSDPVVTAAGVHGFEAHADDMTVEFVDGGHFLPEERPEAVAARILAGAGAD
jgi:pimeloyl-ACP methyl ester carboxylesterase